MSTVAAPSLGRGVRENVIFVKAKTFWFIIIGMLFTLSDLLVAPVAQQYVIS
jgi:hypothetical protein